MRQDRNRSPYSHTRRRRHRRRRRARRRVFWGVMALLTLVLLAVAFWPREEAGPSPSPSAAPTADLPTPSKLPPEDPEPSAGKEIPWNLTLVNTWYPLSEEIEPETVTLTNGMEVDARCYPELQDMMDACRGSGLTPVICSAYRDRETQERLFQNEVQRWLDKGYSQEDAETEAGTVVAAPGTSEHELGLALDIVDIKHQLLDESQEQTAVQQWLMAHSWEYGFVLRYPTDKSKVTGIIYEPWHYRYVGKEDARKIYTAGLCLEEYLEKEGYVSCVSDSGPKP